MTKSYYYFVSSLPSINFDGRPPFSLEAFLEDCRRLLSSNDYISMVNVLSDAPERSSFNNKTIKAALELYRQFHNISAALRATRAGKNPLDYIRGEMAQNTRIIEFIQQASKQDNLYEAEKIIDRAKWGFLDEIAQGQYFNFECVVIYGLKLKMLERYEGLRSAKGAEEYQRFKSMDLSNIETISVEG